MSGQNWCLLLLITWCVTETYHMLPVNNKLAFIRKVLRTLKCQIKLYCALAFDSLQCRFTGVWGVHSKCRFITPLTLQPTECHIWRPTWANVREYQPDTESHRSHAREIYFANQIDQFLFFYIIKTWGWDSCVRVRWRRQGWGGVYSWHPTLPTTDKHPANECTAF